MPRPVYPFYLLQMGIYKTMSRSKLTNILMLTGKSVLPAWFHAIFILVLFFVVSPTHVVGPVSEFLLYKTISLIFPLALVYINFYILIPAFFQKDIRLYITMLLLLLILFVLASYLRFQWINPGYVPPFVRQNQPITSLAWLFIYMTLLNAVLLFFKTTFDSGRKNKEKNELEESRIESEPPFLKLPIAPHFYFNIMNSIYHSITLNPVQAENIILQITGMMQFYIYDCSKEKVHLESEVNNIQNYIGLQKMRLASEPKINVEISGDPADQLIAPFILMTFVENAYKHGLAESREDAFLDIKLLLIKNELQFRILNSKPDAHLNNKSMKGIGLINVRKRLELLYPSRYRLTIEESPAQFAVSLNIQLN